MLVQNSDSFIRGRRILSFDEARNLANASTPPHDPGVFWGGLNLPTSIANTHFCVAGTTGSGKTVLIKWLLNSILPLMEEKELRPSEPDVPNRFSVWKSHWDRLWAGYFGRFHELRNLEWDSFKAAFTRHARDVPGLIAECPGDSFDEWHLYHQGLMASFEHYVDRHVPGHESDSFRQEFQVFYNNFLIVLSDFPEWAFYFEAVTKGRFAARSASRFKTYGGRRILVYDAKQDIFSFLKSVAPNVPIAILNPFDERSSAWDMAADITEPVTAQQIATILIPEQDNSSQPFFSNAARHLLSGVFIALMLIKPGDWDFRDVILSMRSRERLVGLLNKTPHTRHIATLYFADDRQSNSIMSEIATRMAPFEFVAAAWSKCRSKISLRGWLNDEYVLVLGNDEQNRSAIDAINKVIFKRLSELILAQAESADRQTWIFLDEVREAGKLDGLSSLLTKGRSKGACVVIGFQDIEGLRESFGTGTANEIVGMCANKAILRLDSAETAEWASKLFGDYEAIEQDIGMQEGGGETQSSSRGTTLTEKDWRLAGLFRITTYQDHDAGTQVNDTSDSGTNRSWSQTRTHKVVQKASLLPSQLLDMPMTSVATGLSGYFSIPAIGAYAAQMSGQLLTALPGSHPHHPNFIPRSGQDQFLDDWSDEEKSRFGVIAPPKPAPARDPAVSHKPNFSQNAAPNVQEATDDQRDAFISRLKNGAPK